jgi:hypothetical protein
MDGEKLIDLAKHVGCLPSNVERQILRDHPAEVQHALLLDHLVEKPRIRTGSGDHLASSRPGIGAPGARVHKAHSTPLPAAITDWSSTSVQLRSAPSDFTAQWVESAPVR